MGVAKDECTYIKMARNWLEPKWLRMDASICKYIERERERERNILYRLSTNIYIYIYMSIQTD